jgi:hypothetical protein
MTENSLKIQYAELNRYFIEVVKFRFTVLGFFVGGSLVAISNSTRNWQFYAVLAVAIALWIVELRTRIIFRELGLVGVRIENAWQAEEDKVADVESNADRKKIPGYFQRALAPAAEPSFNLLGFRIKPRSSLIVERLLTHSVGIDLVYLTIVAGCILRIAKLV